MAEWCGVSRVCNGFCRPCGNGVPTAIQAGGVAQRRLAISCFCHIDGESAQGWESTRRPTRLSNRRRYGEGSVILEAGTSAACKMSREVCQRTVVAP